MGTYGKFKEHELAQTLQNVSEEEIMQYHKNRMKKYRFYTIIALIFAVLSTIALIFLYELFWISIILAVIGFLLFGYTTFEREKWKRLLENLLYLKRKRKQALEEQAREKDPHYSSNKYARGRKDSPN